MNKLRFFWLLQKKKKKKEKKRLLSSALPFRYQAINSAGEIHLTKIFLKKEKGQNEKILWCEIRMLIIGAWDIKYIEGVNLARKFLGYAWL